MGVSRWCPFAPRVMMRTRSMKAAKYSESAITRNWLRLVFLIAGLFFIKAAVYAWLVTPLWATPDEAGHYSYIEDLAEGNYPVLGKAKMGLDTTQSWQGTGVVPRLNWIAQHPPLYYALDAPILVAARATGMDFDHQVRSTRLLTAFFGAAALAGLALFIARSTGSPELGLAAAIFIGATPMFLHLSSGVTHDTLLACIGAWAAERYSRWLATRDVRFAYTCAVLLALGCITKITVLALAVPLVMLISLQLLLVKAKWRARLLHILGIGVAAFLPITVWMARNVLLFGRPLADSSMLDNPIIRVPIGPWELISTQPFWQQTFLYYVGLLGWSSDGALRLLQMSGVPLTFFTGATLFASLIAMSHPIYRHCVSWPYRSGIVFAAMLITTYAIRIQTQTDQVAVTWTCIALAGAIVVTGLTNVGSLLSGVAEKQILASACVCVIFFSSLYFFHLLSNYQGMLAATQGRYIYPVLPFFVLILAWPWRSPAWGRFSLVLALSAMIFCDAFYLTQAFRFYGQVY